MTLYKLALNSDQEDNNNNSKTQNANGIDTTSRGGVLGGLLALGGLDRLSDAVPPKARNLKYLPGGEQNAFNTDVQNRRLNKLLRPQGYQQSKVYSAPNGGIKYERINPDNHKSIVTDLRVGNNKLRGKPGSIYKEDIHTPSGDTLGVYKKDGIITYEPGSLANTNLGDMSTDVAKMLRSSTVNRIGHTARTINGLSALAAGLVGTGRNTDPEIQKKYDRVGKAIVAAGTLGGLANAGINAHAAYRGGKILQAAGIKDRRSFLGKYKSLPGDLLLTAAPAITYYSARHLPDKIKGLYDRLTNRTQREKQRQE